MRMRRSQVMRWRLPSPPPAGERGVCCDLPHRREESEAVVAAVIPEGIDGADAEQRGAEEPLDRCQELAEVIVKRDERVGVDVDAVAGEDLVVGRRRAELDRL